MKPLRRAGITAVGHFVPPEVYPNSYFESLLDTNDEWIRSRTGIIERRFASTGGTSDLMVPAAQQCLNERGITADEIDCILCATITPDHVFPATACIVQRKLGASKAWGYDISAACSGFLYALETARKMVEAGGAEKVLVCSGDKMSAILDPQDRATYILFGDGAGACLVEAIDDEEVGILDGVYWVDGRGKESLVMPSGGSVSPTTVETAARREHFVRQDGQSVFKAAVVGMADVTEDIMRRNNLTGDMVQWLAPHQANLRIISATANRMGLSMDKVMINIQKFGNTTAGTIPLLLSEWHHDGKLNYGDRIILSSFGAGFTAGSIYLRWNLHPPDRKSVV